MPRKDDKERDSRRFPGHREVLMYLEDFASEFGIVELVRLETEVMFVGMVDGGKWQVRSKKRDGICLDEIYDAVVVCNGHYTEPRVADDIPGNYFLCVLPFGFYESELPLQAKTFLKLNLIPFFFFFLF